MRIAITGASGLLGRQLVPRLQKAGVSLLLVGRDPSALQLQFPGCEAIRYQDIPTNAREYDLLLHLAVMNNNQNATREAFEQVNVDLAVETCDAARLANIKRFVFISSVHALDERNNSFYAETKRIAAARLEAMDGIDVQTVYLPAVTGDELAGKLAVLNRLPRPLRGLAASFLTAMRPTVHVDTIAAALMSGLPCAAKSKPFLLSDGQERNLTFKTIKRVEDLVFAIGILIFLWWAMAIIWIAIRLQSPGPGLFRQERVGQNGRVFTCYKFRTMHISTPNAGTHEISASAVTRLGKLLRRTKLDELPQVINIIANQMSLVGPRPCLTGQTELIAERRARGVLQVKPGITGLAQVNGIDMSNPVLLANWDQRYLKLQSAILDLKIIIQTAIGKGGGDRVR